MTANVNPVFARRDWSDFQSGTTISVQNNEDAVICLEKAAEGEIVESKTAYEFFTLPKNERTRQFLDQILPHG